MSRFESRVFFLQDYESLRGSSCVYCPTKTPRSTIIVSLYLPRRSWPSCASERLRKVPLTLEIVHNVPLYTSDSYRGFWQGPAHLHRTYSFTLYLARWLPTTGPHPARMSPLGLAQIGKLAALWTLAGWSDIIVVPTVQRHHITQPSVFLFSLGYSELSFGRLLAAAAVQQSPTTLERPSLPRQAYPHASPHGGRHVLTRPHYLIDFSGPYSLALFDVTQWPLPNTTLPSQAIWGSRLESSPLTFPPPLMTGGQCAS